MRSAYLVNGSHRATSNPRDGFTITTSSFDAIPGIPSVTIQRSFVIGFPHCYGGGLYTETVESDVDPGESMVG